MLIKTEELPNKNIQNFYPDEIIAPQKAYEYAVKQMQDVSDLAKAVLSIEGVLAVLITPDMVSVQKSLEADWQALKPQILAEIAEASYPLPLKNTDILQALNAVLEAKIRPVLQKDGGNIEIISFKNNVLSVRLQGKCQGCPLSKRTLKETVEKTLQKYISEDIFVYEVKNEDC